MADPMPHQEQEGYVAGLQGVVCMGSFIDCPYDGRTRAGKAWWRGYLRGDSERCAGKARGQSVGGMTFAPPKETK